MKFLLMVSLLLSGSAFAADNWDSQLEKMSKNLKSKDNNAVFEEFLTTYWDHLMVTYPEWATYVGYPGQNDRVSDRSLPALRKQDQDNLALLDFFGKINRNKLSSANQLTFDLLLDRFKVDAEWTKYPDELMALDQMGDVASGFTQVLDSMPKLSTKDYEDRIARLKLLPKSLTDNMDTLKEGLKAGITHPKIVLRKIPGNLRAMTPPDLKKSAFFSSFTDIPSSIPKADQERVTKAALEVIKNTIYPAMKTYTEFVEKEYIPKARDTTGVATLPNGKNWYDLSILNSTTVKKSADEIHETGLREVNRIYAEMDAIRKEVKFKGDMKAFFKYLANAKKFKFKSGEEMLATYRAFGKEVDAKLPMVFRTLPRNTWGVEEVPKFMASSQAGAYYMGGALATGRPGIFYLNTLHPEKQDKWETESLTMHEAVPGHHFQISLAQELTGLPELRKHTHYTAYVEGWGLYAETLGYEMGLYKDPYSKFGQLTNEIWRACRLVVDTGMHAKGWTRQQGIDFMKKYIAKDEQDIITEIDRYLVWPGQALAYKIGQMKIRELRDRATKELGANFQVRDFHDQVLLSGALPLTVLESRIQTWIDQKKTQLSAKN